MRLVCVILLASSWSVALGMKCYSCSYSKDSDTEDTCVKKPQQMTNPTAACSHTYCYIQRIQFTNGGKVSSFARGCIETVKTGKTVGDDYTIYKRTCTSSLCNDWDGIADKYGNGDGDMDGVVIYAPGMGTSSARHATVCLVLLHACLLVLYLAM